MSTGFISDNDDNVSKMRQCYRFIEGHTHTHIHIITMNQLLSAEHVNVRRTIDVVI